ncbi:MAG: ABC transporter ATP-binding protein [Planctomycetaceae bacterium]|nr:ABC transporter ATP-binding protein [Planctomycetaceae bacterium]
MTSAAITCSNLKKTYSGKPPVEAVRGLDLRVEQGECFGVLGPNGAGKTTTIEILEGLLPATSGDVQILGMRWQDQGSEIRQEIGVSLQETQLSEKLTVLETLTLFRSFYRAGMHPQDAMAWVSLDDKSKTWVKNLSGGQKQRLALATALIGEPQLLFLDEPTAGLDPQSRREVWRLIADSRRQGRTVLLTTHYMDEAERLCDRIAIIDRGKVITVGSPQELIASIGGEHVVNFTLRSDVQADLPDHLWRNLPDVSEAKHEDGRYQLSVAQPHLVIPNLLKTLEENGLGIASLTTRQASLEDVFMKVAGRSLNAAEDEFS